MLDAHAAAFAEALQGLHCRQIRHRNLPVLGIEVSFAHLHLAESGAIRCDLIGGDDIDLASHWRDRLAL